MTTKVNGQINLGSGNPEFWSELCPTPPGYPESDHDARFCFSGATESKYGCTCVVCHKGPHASHSGKDDVLSVWPQVDTEAEWRKLRTLVKLLG